MNFLLLTVHPSVFLRESPNSLYVKLGAHDKYATDEEAVVIQASRIFIHPEYNYNTLANDYALIELTSSVAFTDKVWARYCMKRRLYCSTHIDLMKRLFN